jgi:preprotein translocase subunit SecG
MGFLTGTILVLFIFVCLFLILLVMIQTGKGGAGGILGGGSQSVLGSSSADILTKITRVVALLFFGLSLLLSFLFAKRETLPDLPEPTPSVLEEKENGTTP